MRKHGGLQEAGALFSWASSDSWVAVKQPVLRWRFNLWSSNSSTCSTTSRGKLEQAFGLRELHPSFTQHTLVRSVPEKKATFIKVPNLFCYFSKHFSKVHSIEKCGIKFWYPLFRISWFATFVFREWGGRVYMRIAKRSRTHQVCARNPIGSFSKSWWQWQSQLSFISIPRWNVSFFYCFCLPKLFRIYSWLIILL